MHLIWKNLIKNLILHWMGKFKGLDAGTESYKLMKKVWEALSEATAAAGSTIPSAYSSRVPNITKSKLLVSAEMWSFWALYLGLILLRQQFSQAKYHCHFVRLVKLLNICLQFQISDDEIDFIREGFIRWVLEYEDIYYQHDPERISACPVTIHALLHITDSIKSMGPVWCYWMFPMEWYCGTFLPSIRSHRFPYTSLDHYVLESAQLAQIQVIYNVGDALLLQEPRGPAPGRFSCAEYPSCVLLPPHKDTCPPANLVRSIAAVLSTNSDIRVSYVNPHMRHAKIEEWGKVCRIDSDEGDTMCASSLTRSCEDQRNTTFMRYEMLVDTQARRHRVKPVYQLQTFYGCLQHIFTVHFVIPCPPLQTTEPTTFIIAAIQNCKTDPSRVFPEGLDFHYYLQEGPLHFIDVTSVKCLIGWVWDIDQWVILDRSGSLARALHVIDEDNVK
ncbi:hypothetical protein FIBSPDRAFT_751338 [Athelia psychrophila]|uniref:Uncharacterized protein n=1 Tax=Athelia psychrophila TaxID=1759441 RepID=A0A166DIL2_9AGAM|nr:hypothetical protein FIBSPDRAFT_751338 [Fibularhizoctonia sp. CBS 109695]